MTLGTNRCCRVLEILKSTEVAALELGSKRQRVQSGFWGRVWGPEEEAGTIWDWREEFILGGALRLHSSWVV
ncbi:hypothetical protein ACFX1T_046429 [Malus domestica]